MKKSILLFIAVVFSLVSSVVLAQENNGYCQYTANDECRYFAFDDIDITVNGQPLTQQQEQMFCEFIGGEYSQNEPSECTDIFANLVPEFGTITAGLALLGSGVAFMLLRRGG